MPVMDQEARTGAMLCHLAGLAHYVVPVSGIVLTLIVWLVKKDSSPFVDGQGREALNFQITMFILEIISLVLVLVIVGIFMLIFTEITKLVCEIIATVKASNGEGYRYPFTIRFL